MIWLLPLIPFRKLSLFLRLPVCFPSSLLTEKEEGEGGAKSYDGEEAWSPIYIALTTRWL
jgi:hypothetical protein